MMDMTVLSGGLAPGDPAFWLPVVFMGLLAFALLAYVLLDGFDLGVGILLAHSRQTAEQDTMLASVGTFWDANETWLVLGGGVLLVAFPFGYGDILTALYLPATCLLFGLILRGVAFDFRAKLPVRRQRLWTHLFWLGSVLAAAAQGYMLGGVVTGHHPGLHYQLFSAFVGACFVAAYALLGATWLIMKTEGELQRRAVRWARRTAWLTAAAVAAVSVTMPLMSRAILHKWLVLPDMLLLAPVPLVTLLAFALLEFTLRRLPLPDDRLCWLPFALVVTIVVCAFIGLGYSLFPYLIMDRLTIWQGAAAVGSLRIVLWGTAVVLPVIVAYNAYAYWVFRGKAASALHYD